MKTPRTPSRALSRSIDSGRRTMQLESLESRRLLVTTLGPLIQVTGDSPFVGNDADQVAAQAGDNFLDSEVEPYLAINPTNPKNLVTIWQQDRWSNGGARSNVVGVSIDGGETWQEALLPGISLLTGPTPNDLPLVRATDPWVSFSPNGDLYAISLVLGAPQGNRLPDLNAIAVNKSFDGGMTWSESTILEASFTRNVFNDKQSLTADPNDSDFVYATWQASGTTQFTRTTDGGETWEPVRRLQSTPLVIGHQVSVLPDGALVNTFGNFDRLFAMRSTDRGETWDPAQRAVDRQHGAADVLDRRFLVFDPDDPIDADRNLLTVRNGSAHDVAVDPRTGNLYLVWTDARFRDVYEGQQGGESFRQDTMSIAFSMSSDGGINWSPPVEVNQTPSDIAVENQQAFLPSVAVASDGTVGISYYDFRNNTTEQGLLTDVFFAECASDCSDTDNWVGEQRLTDDSFDYAIAALTGRGPFLGDYQGLVADDDDFLSFFSITHGEDPGSGFFRRVRREVERTASDISIRNSNAQSSVLPGESVTYTIEVSNAGPEDVDQVTVVDEFPSQLTEIVWTCAASEGSRCSDSGAGNIRDQVMLRSAGQVTYSVTAVVRARTLPGEQIINRASVQVDGVQPDPFPQNNATIDIDAVDRFTTVWHGAAAIGESGDGTTWDDVRNWARGDIVDVGPSTFPTDDLLFPVAPAETVVSVPARSVVNDMVFESDTRFDGASTLTIGGNISVADGVTAKLGVPISNGGAGISKDGDGTLVIDNAAIELALNGGPLVIDGSAEFVSVADGFLEGSGFIESAVVRRLGTLSAGTGVGTLTLGSLLADGTILAEMDEETDRILVDSLFFFGGVRLDLQAVGPLGDAGEYEREILRSVEPIRTPFSEEPVVGTHVGFGAFVSSFARGSTVDYSNGRIRVVLRQASVGDSNNDGVFNSADLVDVFSMGQYEDDIAGNSSFVEGDWNGDGEFDSSDFVTAFQNGNYVLDAIV